MARKKHRAEAFKFASSARGGGREESALNLFRAPDGQSGAARRWFWGLLAAGLALRVAAALGGNYTLRHDELWQYLEQAHRLVFGHGLIVWEFSVGARSWLTVAPAAFLLAAANFFGLDHPNQYMEAMEVCHAALSMSVPVGMFFFARNYYGEKAAFAALALGCFWHEFVLFAPHALTEFYSAYLIFAALALATPAPSRARALTVGMLLGFALVMRFHHALIVAVVAAAWVFALSRRSAADARRTALLGTVGGVIPIVLCVAVDWATWGFPQISALTYFQAMTDGRVPLLLNNDRPYAHIVNLAVMGGGVCLLALALGLARWRRHALILALALPTFAFNVAQDVQVYTYMFAMTAFFLLIAADQLAGALLSPKLRPAGMAAACAMLAIAVAGFSGAIPERYHLGDGRWVKNHMRLFGENPQYAAVKFLAGLPSGELGALFVDAGIIEAFYYRLHHRVPIYNNYNSSNASYVGGLDWRKDATHVLTLRNLDDPGLEKIYDREGVRVYKTGAKPSPPVPGWTLDLSDPVVIRSLLHNGVIDSPPEKILF